LRKVLLLVAAILVLSVVAGFGLATTGLVQGGQFARTAATVSAYLATVQPSTATPTAVPTVTATPALAPAAGSHTLDVLAEAKVPPRESRALAERLRPGSGPIPEIVNPTPPQHSVGDKDRFYVSNSDTMEVFPITATLRLISQHTEMWVEDGVKVDQKALERAAKEFDERIYPTVHEYCGSEWSPGVDNNPRICILNARFTGAAGYYSSQDEYSRLVNPYSNEREMFYMNADAAAPGTEHYSAILAHEFQHMVHWQLDSNEESWVNEGASELAARLCGFGASSAVQAFARAPETQLNAWSLSPDDDTIPHYGASYLWMEYFMQRTGSDALKAVLRHPEDGIAGFSAVLQQTAGAPSFEELFADWVLANLLNDKSLAQGRYAYHQVTPRVQAGPARRDLPIQERGTVSQFGTRYVAVAPSTQAISIEFRGNPTTAVVPNRPEQGRYEWWSNRGDMGDARLTRAFDLTGVSKATLQYSLWYALEDGWDYAYVEVSADDGATWKLLTTGHTTSYDPNGNAFGPAYTGFSGHPAGSEAMLTPQWIRESIDLTPYAGQRILVRFEVVTDDAVNLPGLCLDNIAVPELGFQDGAEAGDAGWQAEGFVRIDNELPQQFIVQVVERGQTTRIHRLQLDESQRGSLSLNLGSGETRVVLAISGLTPYTTEPAGYSYTITASPS